MKTTARRTDSGWTISGSKYYISAVDQADAILLVTRDAEHSTPENSALSLFVVPTDTPGLTYQQIDTSIVSPDKQFTVFLDDVEVGEGALIGDAGNGLRQVFDGLNPERILVGASVRWDRTLRDRVRPSTMRSNASVWATPIGAHQGIAHPLAEAHIAVELSRMATTRSAELFDAGKPRPRPPTSRSSPRPRLRCKALDQAIQTHGGNGLSHEYGLSELWFVTRLMRTAPVSREMVLNFVAQTSLGLPRSY